MSIGRGFLLRSLDSGLQGLAPDDKILLIRPGTNDGGGDHDINLSGKVRAGAVVYSAQFAAGTLSAASVLDSNAAVPGVSADVVTLILVDPSDLASYGE